MSSSLVPLKTCGAEGADVSICRGSNFLPLIKYLTFEQYIEKFAFSQLIDVPSSPSDFLAKMLLHGMMDGRLNRYFLKMEDMVAGRPGPVSFEVPAHSFFSMSRRIIAWKPPIKFQ
ncbi:hypothetical protein TNCV_899631 [Trichonephila clavipes]|nr:hypothetical protein TNCV_899631 [Trichonephila clavipes]